MADTTSQLSADQQSALAQYTAVTAQDVKDAIPLLQRSQWNVQIAVSKFFDGEGPDPVAEALAAQDHIPQQVSRHENLQESFDRTSSSSSSSRQAGNRNNNNSSSDRPEPAPRIVPQPQTPTHRPPLLLALLFAPFNVGYRAVSALFRTFVYILSFLPASIRPRALTTSLSSLHNNGGFGRGGTASITGGGRRMLPPRDAAARFRREFDEEYGGDGGGGDSESAAAARIPFFEGGFAQALDLAKKDLKFLLVVLVSPEHDDTGPFTRETLLSEAVVSFLSDPNSNLIVWGGNVLDSEAYQVAAEYNCTKFPFSCLICLTPREHSSSGSSNSTRMSIIKRLSGPLSPTAYLAELQSAMTKYAPDLASARAERSAHEVARSLRTEQDSAYERSLALDRERARLRREAEAAARDAEKRALEQAKAAERREQQRQQWRRWRATTVVPEPGADADPKAVVRLALKMPERFEAIAGPGGRVVRRFSADTPLEELYAFVECFDLLQERAARQADEKGGEEDNDYEPPEGYDHVYKFRIASPLPRVVYEPGEKDPTDGKPATLGKRIGRSGNLIVEDISGAEDEEDESEEEGDVMDEKGVVA